MSDVEFIKQKLSELLRIVNELENRFPGRKFTLDGHLFGSLGEAIAVNFYNIDLSPTGTKTHDGTKDGKKVQIKITQGDSVDINEIPEHLLVLFLSKQNNEIYEVYNGPCEWLKDCKRSSNRWYSSQLTKLYVENLKITDNDRLMANTEIKRWNPKIRNR